MPWIIDKIRDILPNRPYGKTAKDFRVARLIDLNKVIEASNSIFTQIEGSLGSGSIYANGFISTSCLSSNITLPDSATFNYQGPLSICTGYTLIIPENTTLTVL
jgi:hypothetical protein